MTSQDEPVLLITEVAVRNLKQAASAAHPNETGGVLIGVHQNGQPWVTEVVEIPTSERGRNHYRLPGGATQPAVLSAREEDGRLGYLGDWHSHPANVGPSGVDLATLALHSLKHPRTPNPTLLVLRRTPSAKQRPSYELDARRITHVRARHVAVEMTGGLPRTPDHPSDPE